LLSKFGDQELGWMLAHPNQKDMAILADLMQSGKVKPVLDRTYKLSNLPEAIRYLEEGHARGKVVITVD
jgi:NADPH:quinone reductase-like Zn-dependent oxidoreductase